MSRNVRDEVDLVTYRTPDYQLSSAPDWNPGRGGDQHHIWQATLGPDAVCFTTHPGPRSARSPGWWTGSATLPRVAQIENVLVAIYRIPRRPALYVREPQSLHARLAAARSLRRGERAQRLVLRAPRRRLSGAALAAAGALGRSERGARCRGATTSGFASWDGRLATDPSSDSSSASRALRCASAARVAPLRVALPGRDRVRLARPAAAQRAGVPQRGFPRYEAPWVEAPFPSDAIQVQAGGESLALDWRSQRREASRFAD